MENNELMHYGILGMKWGIRRYQNKDGTLTKAGQKRYDKEMGKLKAEEKILKTKARTQAKLGKLDAKRKELDDLKRQLGDGKKSAKIKTDINKKRWQDMNDEELHATISRIMDKRYSELTKAQKTKGNTFIKKVLSEMVAPAATDVGKQLVKSALTNVANKSLDLSDEYKVYTNNKKK